MPIYEYQCNACHSDFELLIRGNEKPECPSCDSGDVIKQLSVAAAPKSASGRLPVMGPCGPSMAPGGGCGLPACSGGRCQNE